MGNGAGTMSYEEADRVGLIRAVVEKRMRQREAAKRLGIGVRQVKRLVRRYRSAGPAGLVSRHRGKRPNNAIGEGVRREVLALVRKRYADFGPTLACEKLVGGARSSIVGGDVAAVDDGRGAVAVEGASCGSGAPEAAAASVRG